MPHHFDHENLIVYQHSLEFIVWYETIQERIPRKLSVYDQLDRASTSIPLNIAEGNGKFTEKDRCHFFDIARGSALECAACLDVLVAKNVVSAEDTSRGKYLLVAIVAMIVGLIRNNSSNRVYDGSEVYGDKEETTGDK